MGDIFIFFCKHRERTVPTMTTRCRWPGVRWARWTVPGTTGRRSTSSTTWRWRSASPSTQRAASSCCGTATRATPTTSGTGASSPPTGPRTRTSPSPTRVTWILMYHFILTTYPQERFRQFHCRALTAIVFFYTLAQILTFYMHLIGLLKVDSHNFLLVKYETLGSILYRSELLIWIILPYRNVLPDS